MTEWRAVTESGRIYESVGNGEGIRVSGDRYYHSPVVKSLPGAANIDWALAHSLPEVERPVIGERLLIYSFGGDWRVSTRIVEVEDV